MIDSEKVTKFGLEHGSEVYLLSYAWNSDDVVKVMMHLGPHTEGNCAGGCVFIVACQAHSAIGFLPMSSNL